MKKRWILSAVFLCAVPVACTPAAKEAEEEAGAPVTEQATADNAASPTP